MRHRKLFSKTIAILLMIFALSPQSFAESFTIKISKDSMPLEGVTIYGTDGVNDLPGRFTNMQGEWKLDTVDIRAAKPTLAFANPELGYRFEPSEISLSVQNCPGRVCEIKAFHDGLPTTIIHWNVIDGTGNGVAGIPVTIPGADYPCAKLTDSEGYVLFAVKHAVGTCDDSDTDAANNNLVVAPYSPPEQNCSFRTRLTSSAKVCPRGANFWGYHTASHL
jgi:hypothetical protein